ncbi:MAG: DUF3307 domain-containing protein [Hyphomicrobiales bacterium]|nr:DUF3307 domain-containing protein [Hyphomicrobiales bacterium]MCP4999445.1 DUF3307 domain-containing protein [Hyphomicrobiales bacterium]
MDLLFLWALVGLQIKHFVADYTLQWPSMIAGKCHFNRAGGYVHAGIHILLTLLVLVFCDLPATLIAMLLVFEFIVHYATDYAKGSYDCAHKLNANTRHFWVVHGADQLVHQLTYAIILAVIVYSNLP